MFWNFLLFTIKKHKIYIEFYNKGHVPTIQHQQLPTLGQFCSISVLIYFPLPQSNYLEVNKHHIILKVQSLSRVWLFATSWLDFLPGSSWFPTRLLRPWDFPGKSTEWVAISFSRGSSQPRDQTQVSHIVGRCFTIWATREVLHIILSILISVQELKISNFHGLLV